MAFSQQHIFRGKIDNKNIVDIVSDLDYTISGYEDRLVLVKKLLGEDFFKGYFSEYFKANISTKEELSGDNNICQALLKITDYLLGAEEIREQFKEKSIEYKFYKNEESLKAVLCKEHSLEELSNNLNTQEEVIHFLLKKQNFKKSKEISVTSQDLKREDYTGQVLREYNLLKESLMALKNDEILRESIKYPYGRGKISYMIKELNIDMLIAKKILDGTNGEPLKNLGEEGQVVEWDCFDYTNFNHIRALLYSNATQLSPDNEISFLVYDLQTMIDKLYKNKKLKARDLKIIKMIREGYLQEEIATALNITQERVSAKILHISKKIAQAFTEN